MKNENASSVMTKWSRHLKQTQETLSYLLMQQTVFSEVEFYQFIKIKNLK